MLVSDQRDDRDSSPAAKQGRPSAKHDVNWVFTFSKHDVNEACLYKTRRRNALNASFVMYRAVAGRFDCLLGV